ncbi:plant invertase/pectin methylesterase inhibitor [Striga asiatica]|uniref:Plant invertase/pectin methylesterase inhibitor n=1 Tax=Striga asiatica TaxID=4170 RepID=A0A5A7QLA7_STRAF|nr:plant invertase/pectin methylesterase inhibitor [Striga asiatica]
MAAKIVFVFLTMLLILVIVQSKLVSLEPTSRASSQQMDGYPTWFKLADEKLVASGGGEIKPNVVVAKDGSGHFETINGRWRHTHPTTKEANEADGFLARGITIKNEAGPEGRQAIAFRSSGDSKGLVLQNCTIVPDDFLRPFRFLVRTYLGRPWSRTARTVVMQSYLDDFIDPQGWTVWEGNANHKTCEFFEFSNHGPGAKIDRRNKTLFPKFRVLPTSEAINYTVDRFFEGGSWLTQTGIPYNPGL